jgi:methyl-accepting chemotaxis protein
MTLSDLTISAKLTIATTALVLAVFVLASGAILWGLDGLYGERSERLQDLMPDRNAGLAGVLEQKTVRSVETAGALLAELAGRTADPAADPRLADLIALAQRDPEVAYVDIRDPAGASRIGLGTASEGTYREFPIQRDGRETGTVAIGLKQGFRPAAEAELAGTLARVLADNASQREIAMALVLGLLIVGALVIGMAIYVAIAQLAKRFILDPAERVRNALSGMEIRRDFSQRLAPGANDELGRTVAAFNRGIDFLERQNDQLNDSIIEMLTVGNEISETRDLTLNVPVKDDITGPLRDALNRITSESARVMVQVREIAERVGQASIEVQAQGRRVVDVARAEREEIERTADDLATAVDSIDHIAELARFCNGASATATESTDLALASVAGAVQGMTNIRNTIQETGKRIKRLGERSQEIGSIVDIINGFSERTHVLAINASMQAATAGEAGRGFAVVAQEVQRLADSSRAATSQIATLIANIQVDTSDTVQTVNQATEAVSTESRSIEGAGERMQEIQRTTADLSEAVRQIDERAQAQVAANRKLMERVDSMRAGTVETTDQIDHQTQETSSLVGYSNQLLDAIGLFRLPPPAAFDAS